MCILQSISQLTVPLMFALHLGTSSRLLQENQGENIESETNPLGGQYCNKFVYYVSWSKGFSIMVLVYVLQLQSSYQVLARLCMYSSIFSCQ